MRLSLVGALALVSLLSISAQAESPADCGTKGSVIARIAHCAKVAKQLDSGFSASRDFTVIPEEMAHDPLGGIDGGLPQYIWKLVSQTRGFDRAWLSETSGLIWTTTPEDGDCSKRLSDLKLTSKEKTRRPTDDELTQAQKQEMRFLFPYIKTPADACVVLAAKPKPSKTPQTALR